MTIYIKKAQARHYDNSSVFAVIGVPKNKCNDFQQYLITIIPAGVKYSAEYYEWGEWAIEIGFPEQKSFQLARNVKSHKDYFESILEWVNKTNELTKI